MLWSHNTVISSGNSNPNDPNYYTNSANDFALYNVLGGVAAGREISTSADQGTSTGIQTPNGKICLGTGFGIYSIGSGNVIFENNMSTSSNGGETQSFRITNNIDTTNEGSKTTAFVPSSRSRIWLNIEKGTPPLTGINLNPLKQILIGYSPCFGSDCATTGDSDRVFDAETVTALSNPSIDFYSFAASSTKHLAIQGRGDFQNNDFFQLGYKATDAGTYTITATADGMFTTKPYYIVDANDPTVQYHILPYSFTTASGTFNTRFKVVFENLVSIIDNPIICGTTIPRMSTTIYSQQVPGVTTYMFKVVTSGTGAQFGIFTGNGTYPYQFNLNIPGISYDTLYKVSVATYQVDGQWAWGPECEIRTPLITSVTSNLIESAPVSCNITTNNFWQSLYAGNPSEVGFTTSGWRFEVRTGSPTGTIVGIVERTTNAFSLANLNALGYAPQQSTTYYIRVQIRFNGNWQVDGGLNPVYGPMCTVTTTADAHRYMNNDSSVFETKAYPNPFTKNFNVDINTSSEEPIQIVVYNIVGQQIESRTVSASNLDTQEIGANYKSGIYNVIIKQGDRIKTLRIIKR